MSQKLPSPAETSPEKTLLIASVGGTSQPVVAAVIHWQPTRAVFIVSPDTKATVTTDKEFQGKPSPCVLTSLKNNGIADFDGRWDFFEISDPQDYAALVAEMRKLDANIARFKDTAPIAKIVVDITGGTKAMSAALALTASRWESCEISYVGGSERGKGGIGVVVDGKEQIAYVQNPWAALGYLVEEQARTLFNNGDYSGAIRLLTPARAAVPSPRKEELNALIHLCELIEAWDNFQHADALKKIPKIERNWNNLPLGEEAKARLQSWLTTRKPLLKQLAATSDTAEKRTALALDLIANAARHIESATLDDAVARLYRATEALAQARLQEHGFSKTDAVPFSKLPEALREEWKCRPRKNGSLKLALQDDYKLLDALDDELGKRFIELKLNNEKSSLSARNQSILAHGFQPISKNAANALFSAVLKLAECKKNDLLTFPKI